MKRIPMVIATILTILTLAACQSSSPAPQTQTPAESRAATETPVPTETPTAEPTKTAQPETQLGTELSGMLGSVPAEFSGQTIVFSFNDHSSRGGEAFPEGRAMHSDIAASVVNLDELAGLDFRWYEWGIWSWEPGNDASTFMVFQGPVAEPGALDRLRDLGFREAGHMGTTYLELDEDFSFDVRHELRRTGLTFNRLALLEDTVLAAPATGIIEGLIAARQEASKTLADSLPHLSLVDAAGNGLVTGAFLTPQWLTETWNTVNPKPPGRLDRYREGPEAWGTLPEYGLALTGYRANENEIVVALFLPAGSGAQLTSQELAARWDSYGFDASGPFSEEEDVPLNRVCFPFTTRTVQNGEYAVLTGSCPVTGEGDSSLWTWLFNTRQLEFLIPDLEHLK